MAHIPMTRICATTGISGVPLGAQIAWLSISTNGCPLLVTRVAAMIHWAVMHGTGPPLRLNGQPATTYGAAIVTVGWPPTSTRGLGTVGCACPPWAQSTVAPR